MKKTIKILLLAGIILFLGQKSSFAQKYGATPEDSVKCIENISIYQEFWKQQNYGDCYEAWRNVLKLCPSTSKNLYIRGVPILRFMIEKHPEQKNKYMKEMYELFDLRTKYYGEAEKNEARKAMEMRNYYPDSVKAIYDLFDKVAKTAPNEFDPAMSYSYFLATVEYVRKANADATLVVENYDQVTSLLENDKKNETDPEQAKAIQSYIDNIEAIFSPFATCEQLVTIFTKKYLENPTGIELLKKITSLLENKKCSDQELFFLATESLHKLEPTAKSAYMMGKMSLEKKQYSKAAEYFKEAFDGATDTKDKYNAALMLANNCINTGQYQQGRTYAYKAAELIPTEGQPYIVIAQLYAQSASSCGSGSVYGRVAYWAAVDKCVKAKTVDPDITEQANRMINSYSANFPSQADAFFEGLEDGKSYTIPCWIGETTIIRTRK